ncbi:MAG: hypothetical protein Q9167_005950 [Letrouitia subvulpina]
MAEIQPAPLDRGSAAVEAQAFKNGPPVVPRSTSDSVVHVSQSTGCIEGDNLNGTPPEDVTIQTSEQGTLVVAARALPPSSLSSRLEKTGQKLQLPSFQALGIANTFQNSILTPPDEVCLPSWVPIEPDDCNPPSLSTQPINSSVGHLITPVAMSSDAVPEASGGNVSLGQTDSPLAAVGDEPGDNSTSSSHSRSNSDMPQWLEPALAAVCKLLSTFVFEPCPISQAINIAPTALTSTLTALQSRFESIPQDRYIDITHAVPTTFHFSQLPSSPVSTPNRAPTGSGDYFSLPRTVVFAKAAVANDHSTLLQAASENPVFPPWPQTVVAPSSINVSILERFIPPASAQEYLDLFSTDQPSALVDRLLELSPTNGSLIFVYPTAQGAATFTNNYLMPILSPLLLTMAGLHGITYDFGQDFGQLEACDKMYGLERIKSKIQRLLTKLGHSRGCQYSISTYYKQVVLVDREAWSAWFTEQETPRIRHIVNRYFQRNHRLPQNRNITASTLVREVVDGIKGRAYDSDEPVRSGIEVGVFVMKRTA